MRKKMHAKTSARPTIPVTWKHNNHLTFISAICSNYDSLQRETQPIVQIKFTKK